jgi:outer membrane protein OmpA-like peptidoglycan-associated protein
MSIRTRSCPRRAALAALGSLLVVGCSTAPAPSAKEARIATLRKLGFTPARDGWELSLGVKLLFDSGVDQLSDDGHAAVADLSQTLSTLGIERIRVEGHTDSVGSASFNVALSRRRAESVAQRLVALGWRDDVIERQGFGADKPVAENATPEGRAQNRRVVIAVQAE